MQASKAARDAKRRQLVEQRRHAGAPRLLGVMCLHCSVDTHAAWQQLYAACWAGVDGEHAASQQGGMECDEGMWWCHLL